MAFENLCFPFKYALAGWHSVEISAAALQVRYQGMFSVRVVASGLCSTLSVVIEQLHMSVLCIVFPVVRHVILHLFRMTNHAV